MAREGRRPSRGPLLVGEQGGLTRTTINRIVTKVAAAARITPAERVLVTPHAFRHSVATQLVRKRDLVTAADLLGHSSLATTRRYSKASAQNLEAAVDTLYEGCVRFRRPSLPLSPLPCRPQGFAYRAARLAERWR